MPMKGKNVMHVIMRNVQTHARDGVVSTNVLRDIIVGVAGLDERTIKKYLVALVKYGYLKQDKADMYKVLKYPQVK